MSEEIVDTIIRFTGIAGVGVVVYFLIIKLIVPKLSTLRTNASERIIRRIVDYFFILTFFCLSIYLVIELTNSQVTEVTPSSETQKIQISGKVTYRGTPVMGARVEFKNRVKETDSSGAFEFNFESFPSSKLEELLITHGSIVKRFGVPYESHSELFQLDN